MYVVTIHPDNAELLNIILSRISSIEQKSTNQDTFYFPHTV